VIGQAALILLKHSLGVERVDLFDVVASRAKLAQSFGARIAEAGELQVAEGADYATLYRQARYDVVLETTGVASVFANALNLLKPGGMLGCVGMIAKAEIPQKQIVAKALTIVGSIGGTGEFPEVIEFIAAHRELAERLISHRIAINDATNAFTVARNAGQSMKVMLTL
jgi:threonine dehydrogenase-like Zn-dependent dehydrogenase